MSLGNCTFCGDPAVKLCTVEHRDWTIIHLGELKAGDLITLPLNGKIYSVKEVSFENDCASVITRQTTIFEIPYLGLPVLVKRRMPCGYPCCDFHCHKCMRLAKAEELRNQLLGEKVLRRERFPKSKTKLQRANADRTFRSVDYREEP